MVDNLPLAECLDALIDYRGKTPRKVDSGIPLITAKLVKAGRIEPPNEFIAEEDYETWMTRGYPKIGDIVLTTEAPLGEVAQIKFLPVALAQRIVTLRGKRDVLDNGYLLYLLQSGKFQAKLVSRSSGTTVIGIKQSELRKIEVTLPPLEEQRAIAHILGTLDVKIELNRRMNQTLEAMAQALFKSWFVNFDGVPPEDIQESKLGLIPKGWRVGTLADLCELNAAKWTAKKHPPTVRYIDLSGVSANRIEVVSEFAFDQAPSRARMHLREGDTIVGTVRPGNRAFAYIHAPNANLTCSTGFAVLSPKQPHYASFAYLAATRDEAIERLANLADGAAYPAVRPDVVAGTPCTIAPDNIITEFSDHTKASSRRIFPFCRMISSPKYNRCKRRTLRWKHCASSSTMAFVRAARPTSSKRGRSPRGWKRPWRATTPTPSLPLRCCSNSSNWRRTSERHDSVARHPA